MEDAARRAHLHQQPAGAAERWAGQAPDVPAPDDSRQWEPRAAPAAEPVAAEPCIPAVVQSAAQSSAAAEAAPQDGPQSEPTVERSPKPREARPRQELAAAALPGVPEV
jgi:hypothetical protein